MNLDKLEEMVNASIPLTRTEVMDLLSDIIKVIPPPDIEGIEKVPNLLKGELMETYFLTFQNFEVDPDDCLNRVKGLIVNLENDIDSWKTKLRSSPGIVAPIEYMLPENYEGSFDSKSMLPFLVEKDPENHSAMEKITTQLVQYQNGVRIKFWQKLLSCLNVAAEATQQGASDEVSQQAESKTKIPIRVFHGNEKVADAFYGFINHKIDEDGGYCGILTPLKALCDVFQKEGLVSELSDDFYQSIIKWLKVKQSIGTFKKQYNTKAYTNQRTTFTKMLEESKLKSLVPKKTSIKTSIKTS